MQSVTVLASNTSRYGHAAGLEGIEEAAREAGFAMSLRVIESGAPVAAMIPFPEDGAPTRPSVWIDEFDAEATSDLLGVGHAAVHHLSIPCRAETTRRMTGWRSALEQGGAPVPALLVSGWSLEWGYEAGRQIARDPSVTAVLCGKLDIAVGAIRAMHEAGRSTPRDVSIVGVDDMPLVRFLTPALTTAPQDFKPLGKACVTTLRSTLDARRSTLDARRSTLDARRSTLADDDRQTDRAPHRAREPWPTTPRRPRARGNSTPDVTDKERDHESTAAKAGCGNGGRHAGQDAAIPSGTTPRVGANWSGVRDSDGGERLRHRDGTAKLGCE